LSVQPSAVPPAGVQLKLADKPAAAAQTLRREWLGV
jgi:hypothetical protein